MREAGYRLILIMKIGERTYRLNITIYATTETEIDFMDDLIAAIKQFLLWAIQRYKSARCNSERGGIDKTDALKGEEKKKEVKIK